MICEHFTKKEDIGRAEFTLPGGSKAIAFEGASGKLLKEGEGICGMAPTLVPLTGGSFAVCPISRNPIERAEECILNPKPGETIELIRSDDL